MQGKKISLVLTMMVAVLFIASIPVCISTDEVAASEIKVTDGLGNEFVFDDIPKKIVTMGKGFTSTAIELGQLDKIMVADSYSATDSDPIFDGLKEKIANGEVLADSSGYGSTLNLLVPNVAYMVDYYDLRNSEIAIFIAGSATFLKEANEALKKYGFNNVLCWYSVKNYEDVINFVETFSKVTTGTITDAASQMRGVAQYIDETLSEKTDFVKREAFAVTYSSNDFKIYSAGSISDSMIHAAGGISISDNPNSGTTSYGNKADVLNLVAEYGTDVVIFVDNSVISKGLLSDLRDAVGSDVKLVHLDPLWNNFGIRCMDGVWAMACAMYPDTFSGDVPELSDDSDDNNVVLYVTIGVVSALVVGLIAFFFIKK